MARPLRRAPAPGPSGPRSAPGRAPGRLRRRRRRGPLRGSPGLRLRVGFLVIAMVLSVFGARLVQLQGVDPQEYARMAAIEGTVSVVLPAARGDILGRNGVPLAESVSGMMVVADPSLTEEYAPELAALLAKRLDVDYVRTLERLRTQDSRFQYIARKVPAAQARKAVAEAEERGYEGLRTHHDPVRFYPAHDVAANVTGFLGTPTNDGQARPLAGLEATLDQYLSGRDGEARYQVGAGSRIPLGENTVTEAQDGEDLRTTIDRDLQWYTQRVLRRTVEGARGDSGFAVVMDSRTGEVISLADHPTFDASAPQEHPEETYASRALRNVYEPGSVSKVLTVAGLIDSGEVTSRTRFEVPSALYRGGEVINDYFEHGTLRLTMAGIIAKSSNIGTVMAADQYERGELRSYLSRFGMGRHTGVALPGESRGLLPPKDQWTSGVGDRVAFGQSYSVNALQMTAAVNTIANGGVRVDPSLIQGAAQMDDGTRVGSDLADRRRVVSKQAARQTTRMMELVVDEEVGTAPQAGVPGYRVAGKTGTAQAVGDECGCYDGTYTVSFAGFAPADDPRFTVYVVVHNPRNGGGGGSVAGPAFSKIMGQALSRYGVEPSGTQPPRLPVEW